jgi:hypothetical protein
MSIALAVLSAAAALGGLPQLPERGLALETKAGVQLQTMGGKPLASLPGLDLAEDWKTSGALTMRDRAGTIYVLDARRRRLRNYGRPQSHPACRYTDAGLSVCKHTIKSGSRVLARAPRGIGHWVWAARAPRGNAILAQWSAECEVPVAYLVTNGRLRAFGSESVALGWLPTGEAVVQSPNGGCASGWRPVSGIYAAVSTTKMRLLLRTKRFSQYLMWGG